MAEHAEQQDRGWIVSLIQIVFVVGIIVLALLMTSVLNASQQSDEPTLLETYKETSATSVRVAQPEPENFDPVVTLNGTVQARTEVSVSPQVSGEIARVGASFKPGNLVRAGDLLFEIDRSDYLLSVEQAGAEIAAAKSDLAQLEAESDLARQEWEELFPDREITDLAAKIPQIDAAKARLLGAEANLQTAQLALKRTRVTAASDVLVLSTTLDVGQVVSQGQTLGRLVSIDSIEITVPLSTDQLATLQPVIGRDVAFGPRGLAQPQKTGSVVRLDASLEERTRLASLYVKPETSADLTLGEFVDVTIAADPASGALRLPSTALFAIDKVWVVQDGRMTPRTIVSLGEDGDEIIVAGFDIADGVVIIAPVDAYEGQPVTLRNVDASGLAEGSTVNAGQ